MRYWIVRFKLKSFDGARETALVRQSPVLEGTPPAVGDIVRIDHHGTPFDAKVYWGTYPSPNDPHLIARLKVEEL